MSAAIEVRLYGDSLSGDAHAIRLQRFRAQAEALGVPCALAPVLGPATSEVPSTAPLVVFGDADTLSQARLEFLEACAATLCIDIDMTWAWLRDVAVEFAVRVPDPAVSIDDLQPYLALPPATGVTFIHVVTTSGASDASNRSGTDLVLAAFARLHAESTSDGRAPRLVVFSSDNRCIPVACPADARVEFREGLPTAEDLRDALAVVQPLRELVAVGWNTLLPVLAAARPLILSSFSATNRVLREHGVYIPVGGFAVEGRSFEPDPRAVTHAMRRVLRDPPHDLAERARRHVLRHHVTRRSPFVLTPFTATPANPPANPPASPPASPPAEADRSRPSIVLEASLFEVSSTSVLTLETARALARRGRVDVRLRPTAPFQHTYAGFVSAHPDLVPLLCEEPTNVDLWLSAGWPVRMSRPECRRFGLRIDWEYGALPVSLSPAVTQEADYVVVHSEHVRRSILHSGRRAEGVVRIPHGVDGSIFHDRAAPLEEVLNFKRDRRALLFVGGLIWRKGFDLVIKALVEGLAGANGDRPAHHICLVVKPIGSDSSYKGHNLRELIERVRRFPNVPEILVLERELTPTEMAGLYTASDLLLHPYRGEGFCIPALEARACGLPLLVTQGGSTDDFCTGEACVQIPSTHRFVPLPDVHIGRPLVFEPDFDCMLQLLREMLSHVEVLHEVARRDAQHARTVYTWEHAAAQLEQLTFAAAGVTGRARSHSVRPASPADTRTRFQRVEP